MKRYLAGFAGLFFFVNIVGCAAEEVSASERTSSDESPVAISDLPDGYFRSSGPTCLVGKYTSSWSTIELFPNGQGLRTERLHDGNHASMAQGRFFWSATDRTLTIGVNEQPMRVEADCRFVWIGDAMFTRAAQ